MYSRKICEKCKLTVFADSEEKLDNMVKRYRCQCESEVQQEQIPEYIGKRKLRSSNNIRLVIDDYESKS